MIIQEFVSAMSLQFFVCFYNFATECVEAFLFINFEHIPTLNLILKFTFN